MRYKNPVLKNLENSKVTLEMVTRMVNNKNIQTEDLKKSLERVIKSIDDSLDMVGREYETR